MKTENLFVYGIVIDLPTLSRCPLLLHVQEEQAGVALHPRLTALK